MKDASLLERDASSQTVEPFSPIRICELELSEPLSAISAFAQDGDRCYLRARCLIRLHTQPLGLVELALDASEGAAQVYVQRIWQEVGEQVNAHLRADGLPEVQGLDEAGLSGVGTPRCVEERETFLKTAPFVSVILATRDRPEALARCLPTVLAQKYPDYEVIVVDNAPSTTATADLIARIYGDEPRIHYVREDEPGLPQAHNCGLLKARGEIIAFTDDDVVVDTHWLAGLVRGFSATENVAGVTGLVVPLELETPAQFLFEAYGGFTRGFDRRMFDLGKHRWQRPSFPYIVGACTAGTGASMAFTAQFLKSEGGFDPALGPGRPSRGGEDLAAYFRVIRKGYCLVYEPSALLYHQHRQDYRGLQKQMYDYGLGFTAYLTKIIVDEPWLIFDCCAKVMACLLFLVRTPRTAKPEEPAISVPEELKQLEARGRRYGSLAYLKSRWATGWGKNGLSFAQASARKSSPGI
jgi:glycosyltransferase involved in cell wall biosynthesis